MNIDLNNFVESFVFRDVKKLYLSFLYLVEDLRNENKISEEEFVRIRKRILDHGNNCARSIQEQLDNFDFTLKNK
jgi:hypothetical protein